MRIKPPQIHGTGGGWLHPMGQTLNTFYSLTMRFDRSAANRYTSLNVVADGKGMRWEWVYPDPEARFGCGSENVSPIGDEAFKNWFEEYLTEQIRNMDL